MKTIELRDSFGIDSLVLADRPKPTPGPGDILLKVNAASLNYRDLLVVDGTFFPNLQFPFVPASDAAGQVEQVGPGVTKFKPGDRVRVLYLESNPEVARIDAFSTLWQQSLVVGIWGAVWSGIPVLILVVRRRRASTELVR